MLRSKTRTNKMSSSSIHLQITFWLLIISPFAFSRIFTTNETLIFPLTTQKRFSSPSTSLPFKFDDTISISLTIGSPPQNIRMSLDTGSELSWLHCSKTSAMTHIFDHTKSSSYVPLPCSSPVCTAPAQNLPMPTKCDKKTNNCHVGVSYVDGTAMDGNLAHETFRIGSKTKPALAFGCMFKSTSKIPDDVDGLNGLIGMNRARLSFANQMGLSKFSYCISGVNAPGVLVLGEASLHSLPPLKYTPLVNRRDNLPYWDRFAYTVQFEGIRVGSKLLPIPRSAFLPTREGKGQTTFDSGTQFTYLLGPVYNILKAEFIKQTHSLLTVEPKFVFQIAMDLCFRAGPTKPNFSKLPTVTLMFAGAELTVSGQKLLYSVEPEHKYCFTFGNSNRLTDAELFIIGNYHQQNAWVEHDLAHARIGIANGVNCDQARKQLGS